MDGYLLETNLISSLLDPSHSAHGAAAAAIAALDPAAPQFISVVTLAEIGFGLELHRLFKGAVPERLQAVLVGAKAHSPLAVTSSTAAEYAALKAHLAQHYLAKAFGKQGRPRWIEDWIDRATGQKLQLDENDLWICAQARERKLVLITSDADIERVAKADPAVRVHLVA